MPDFTPVADRRPHRPIVFLLLALAALGLAVLWPAGAWAQERPGTLSLGIQGQYGIIGGPSDFAEDYDWGPGFGIRIRYALGGPQAFGISFESQTFDPDSEAEEGLDQPEELKFANVSLEYLRYFNRGEGRSQYAAVGAGLAHPSEVRSGGIAEVSDALLITGGGGLEVFVHRTTAIDVSLRGYAMIGESVTATAEIAAGIHFYLIK
jgi:Outer membrane protein beta-barrel domain